MGGVAQSAARTVPLPSGLPDVDPEDRSGSDADDSDGESDDGVHSSSCVDIAGVLYDADTLSDLVNSYVHELTEDTCDSDDLHASQTVSTLVANLDSPLWEVGGVKAPLTVYQASCLALSEKRTGGIKDTAFDRQCKVVSELLLPKGNLYPRSKYLMERVIGCRTLDEVALHVCPKECVSWARIPKKEWKDHEHDACSKCGSMRFKRTLGGTLTPQKMYFYFGVENCIKSLFLDDDFAAARATSRTSDPYYTSPEASRLYTRAGYKVDDLSVSAYTLGVDGAQLFQTKVHSMWLVLLQCNDLPSQCRSQRRFVKVIGIIPGPREPRNFQTYMVPVAQEFQTGKCEVTLSSGEKRLHKFLLAAVAGDSPGVKKVTQHVGHSAYLGCPHCVCRGVKGPLNAEGKGGGMYFPPQCEYGVYNVGERQGAVPNSGVMARVGDACTKSSHVDMKGWARSVQADHRKPSDVGFKGLCVFARCLRYWDYSTMVLVPLAHAALSGVVKDFVTMVLGSLDKEAIRVIKSRAAHFTVTCDISRAYMCVVTQRGNMTMEHWLSFLEHDGVYIFQDVLPLYLSKMWMNLRKALLFAFRREPVDDAAGDVDEMMQSLHSYAHDLYNVFGLTACKYNLHVLLCHLSYQFESRGALWCSMEFWIEQYIQFGKSSVRYRATASPELILVHDLCVDDALLRARYAHGVFRDMPARYRDIIPDHDRVLGGHLDGGDTEGNQMLGAGVLKFPPERRKMVVRALKELLETTPVDGWNAQDAKDATFVMYKRAHIRWVELVHSRMYKRNRTRVSRFVMAQYVEAHGLQRYVADVSMFIIASFCDKEPIRFGIADISRVQVKKTDVGSWWESSVGDHTKAGHRVNYGVRVQDMTTKMIKVDVPGDSVSRFLEYANASGTGRWGGFVGDDEGSE